MMSKESVNMLNDAKAFTKNLTPVPARSNLLRGLDMVSPLAGVAALMAPLASGAIRAISVAEKPFLELINVKGEADSEVFLAAIKNATGAALPLVPNTVSESDDYVIYWLAPNEWLIQSTQPRVP